MSASPYTLTHIAPRLTQEHDVLIERRANAGFEYAPVTVRSDSNGKVVDRTLTGAEIDLFVQNSLQCAYTFKNYAPPGSDIYNRARQDSAGCGTFQTFAVSDPRAIRAKSVLTNAGLLRADADVGGGIEGGLWLPYQLTAISGKVLQQPMPPLNARKLFPVDSEAGIGAQEFAVRRTNVRARAAWSGAAAQTPIPDTHLNQNEIKTKIRYGISAFKTTIFDLASANFGNFLLQDNGIRGTVRGLAELENYTCWNGDSQVGLFGVLSHPYLPRTISSVTTSSTSQEIANAILAAINAVYTSNFTTFMPTDVAMSPKLKAYLMGKAMVIGSTGVAQSVMEYVAKNNVAQIPLEKFVAVQELTAVGPAGEEGMFIYAKDPDAVRIISTGGPQSLPVQFTGVDVTQIFYQGIGGLNMYNPANNALALFDLR